MCCGIFAGSSRNLSMRSAFPAIHQYETSHGTIVGGALLTKPGMILSAILRVPNHKSVSYKSPKFHSFNFVSHTLFD